MLIFLSLSGFLEYILMIIFLFALPVLLMVGSEGISDWAERKGGAIQSGCFYITIFGFFIAVLATCVS
jgi:small-conductance mechanosensitive channel